MMLLQFFIWGGWFVTMGSYLAANRLPRGPRVRLAYSTNPGARSLHPSSSGLIEDKYFNAERLLADHSPHRRRAAVPAVDARRLSRTSTRICSPYMILYMPTLAWSMRSAFGKWRPIPALFPGYGCGGGGWIIAGLVIQLRVFLGCTGGTPLAACSGTRSPCVPWPPWYSAFTASRCRKRRRGSGPDSPCRYATFWGLDALALLKDRKLPGVSSSPRS